MSKGELVMKKIEEVDSNFKVKTNIDKKDVKFYDVMNEPFKIHGVFFENGKFRRMTESVAKNVSEGVYYLHSNTAGGRVRFKTDSEYIVLNTHMVNIGKMPHFPLTGSAGFDLYVDDTYVNTFVPPFDIENGYEGVINFEKKELRDVTINFPLYSDVEEVYIGLSENASLLPTEGYENKIVYYGSSITQGGCASRPGNSYESIISRQFDCDYINLGFSGSARAEDEIIEYIKKLDMSVFVYDYDHNAPSVEHLKNTHEKMFKAIRTEKPNIPIVIMSRPKFILNDEEKERLNIIRTTYNNAKASGDNNVYLITGPELMEFAENEGTVDNCHPNDLGFASMAKCLGKVLKEFL